MDLMAFHKPAFRIVRWNRDEVGLRASFRQSLTIYIQFIAKNRLRIRSRNRSLKALRNLLVPRQIAVALTSAVILC